MDNAAGKDANRNFADKLLHSVSDVKEAEMSMQNQWKLLSQLKDYLNKTNYDKNQPIGLYKDWLDRLQRLTYSQLEIIRKLSSESNKITIIENDLSTKHDNDPKNVKIILTGQTKSLTNNPTIAQPRIQQVIVHIK
jgi:hypothetical protein